jgi:hypothetical protein
MLTMLARWVMSGDADEGTVAADALESGGHKNAADLAYSLPRTKNVSWPVRAAAYGAGFTALEYTAGTIDRSERIDASKSSLASTSGHFVHVFTALDRKYFSTRFGIKKDQSDKMETFSSRAGALTEAKRWLKSKGGGKIYLTGGSAKGLLVLGDRS